MIEIEQRSRDPIIRLIDTKINEDNNPANADTCRSASLKLDKGVVLNWSNRPIVSSGYGNLDFLDPVDMTAQQGSNWRKVQINLTPREIDGKPRLKYPYVWSYILAIPEKEPIIFKAIEINLANPSLLPSSNRVVNRDAEESELSIFKTFLERSVLVSKGK